MPRRLPLAVALVLGAAGLAACGGGSTISSDVCDGPAREPLADGSLTHILEAGDVSFDDPAPTSGPHLNGLTRIGIIDEPLPGAEQVTMLEYGGVLLQYRDPGSPEQAELEALADPNNLLSPGVVVAPNPDIDAPVVVTAWTQRMTCTEVDVEAISAFIDEFRGQGAK